MEHVSLTKFRIPRQFL